MYRDLWHTWNRKYIFMFLVMHVTKNKEAAILCRYVSTGARNGVQLGVSSLYPDTLPWYRKDVRSESIKIGYTEIKQEVT